MIEQISGMHCIDLARIYLQGESNGAMLAYYLLHKMPNTFAAMSPWYGQPLAGHGLNEAHIRNSGHMLQETGILQLHLRQDVTVPFAGGVSEDKWIFEPISGELQKWARNHDCEPSSASISTQWDGGSLNFRCEEFLRCQKRRRIIGCLYDGEHGTWPEGSNGNDIAVWFFRQHARKSFSLNIQTQ